METFVHFWLLWATAAIWIAFLVYWSSSAAGAAASPATPSGRRRWIRLRTQPRARSAIQADPARRESISSRQVHQLLLQAALLLALLPGFWPLNRPWLNVTPFTGLLGLAVQLAFAGLYLWGRRHL